MNRRHPAFVAVTLGLAFATIASGCSGGTGKITVAEDQSTNTDGSADGSGGSSGTAADGALRWGSCQKYDIAVSADTESLMDDAGMACATLDVPIRHDEPDGPTLGLAVGRIPASGPKSERIGSLIVNPGGPGGSGLEFLASASVAVPEALRKRFDLVSFDPRGVALSEPVNCLSERRREEVVEAEAPDDPAAQVAESIALEAEIAEGCTKAPDDLELHMGTDEVVNDLDALREAVGDDQLTFLGLSYGTRIGAAYATRFPDRVRAIVLDGSVTPSRDLVDLSAGQVKGIARSLVSFVDACNADASCPLAPDAMGRIEATADLLDATPLEVDSATGSGSGTEKLDEEQFVTGLVTALYDPTTFEALALAIDALSGPDEARAQMAGSFLLNLAGLQNSKRPDGTYGNGLETQRIVNCLDSDGPLEAAELPTVRAEAGPIPPVLDTDPATDSPSCTALATNAPLSIGVTDAVDRILVVGTAGDPATPIEWTGEMAAALGGPAVLRYEGAGHTASTRIDCVTAQVAEFFDDAAVPSGLADCPRDPEESDIYATLASQFDALGMGAGIGDCIAKAVRPELDPLEIVSLNSEEPDPKIVRALQQAAVSCR